MALQNIGASNRDDAFYRYKMPKLVTKIEGRGNGIKTNLVNMVEVAKALARAPAYTTKFFGCELGAQSKFDEKTGTAIVNGAHDNAKLAGHLENFIKKYVQCYGCGNPETEISITRNQLIKLQCAACGFVSDVDMRDKLTTFILKNPPDQKKKTDKKGMRKPEIDRMKAGEALDENVKKGKRDARKKKSDENGDGNGHVIKKKLNGSDDGDHSPTSSQSGDGEEVAENDDVEWLTDTSSTAAQQRIKEQLNAVTSEMVNLNIASDDHRVVKKANDPIVHEGSNIPSKFDKKPSVKDSSLEKEELVKEFRKCLESGFSAMQLAAHLQRVQSPTSEQEAMNAYFEALFGGLRKGVAKDIGKKKLFLSKAMEGEHSQELLLGAVEAYFSSGPAEVCKEIALVLKMLYDLDIVEEDAVLVWYGKNSANGQVRKLATPFVEWLQNAESEDESSAV
ncbi:hypothetical protein GOP47_0022129 [Adiantum capillus-veneris]|uniref:W2 domain-containing protein n=1 Tax=Adiantum capillus-veneris TaxID=13818 RepID=A0A9D4U9M7_ADICA|nr:hypothetical protein GOP47_0022129 [Adiantum capillus-veneris]